LVPNLLQKILDLKNRYGDGYDCLVDTESKVNIMQKELEDL
jgi:dynein heavy chain